MSIAATADALQTIAQTVSGIAAGSAPAFGSYTTLVGTDGKITDSLLPVVMSWPEQSRLEVLGNTEYEMFTDWGMWVFAARDHQTNFVAGMTLSMTLAQGFAVKFLDKDSYPVTDGQFILTAGPPVVYVNRHSGVPMQVLNLDTKITFAGISYHGFKLVIQTKEEGTL